MEIAPYGSWQSPLDLVSVFEQPSPAQFPAYYRGRCYWVEARAREGGRVVLIQRDANVELLRTAQCAAEGVEEKELCSTDRLLRELVVGELVRPRGKMPGGKISVLLGSVVTGHDAILSSSWRMCQAVTR